MLELSEFDLEFTFVGTGSLGENIQNQTGTVENATLKFALNISLLAWRQRMVKQYQLAVVVLQSLTNFRELSRPNERSGVGMLTLPRNERNGITARRGNELNKFVGVFTLILTIKVQVNKYCPLT